jgi:hypothetical protein
MLRRETLILQELFRDGWKVSEDPASPGKYTLSITGLTHEMVRLIAALFSLSEGESL